MRAILVLMLLSTSMAPSRAAEPPKLAVFDFEMLDTSLEGQMRGRRADERNA